MNDTVKWAEYEFMVFTPDVKWNDVGGIYIFCGKVNVNGQLLWNPLYIGQAQSFAARLSGHDRWQEAVKLGATHIHAMVVQQEANRDKIEAYLVEKWKPPLNTHLK